jgi:PAS domain S-box-containing protein
MTLALRNPVELQAENAELRRRLEETEATLQAISGGEVDAFLIRHGSEDRVLVLGGVDRPYRLLIERMSQGAATLSVDGTVVYANRRLAELLGAGLSGLLGVSLGDFLAEADRPALADLLTRGLSGDAELELILERSDGKSLPALLSASRLLEEEDVLCLIVTDLTQKKRQEVERERLLEEQSARVAAERTTAVLRETDRRKDEFLAMLAHELRNPLAPLRNGIQVLSLVGGQDPTADKTREMMSRQVESLIRLVDDLLDVSRVSQGKIQLQKEPAELCQVVAGALESCRPVIDERGHQLEVELPEEPLPVVIDAVRISQVVINLLNNAAKFTPPGGRIGLSLERIGEAKDAVVKIRDSGIGIAPEMLPRIFGLFAQADPSVSRSEGGLGIGLTLARRLVEMHGGRLHAESAGLGKGSEFVVRIPLSMGEAVPGGERPAIEGPQRSSSLRILVVDDNRDAGESLSILLRLFGHEVRQAFDGPHAVTVAEDFGPDVVLLDIGMPGMSGYEVAEELQARPALANARLIALTGYGSAEDRSRSHAAGFHAHLVKPVELAALEPILAAIPAAS